MQHIVRNRLQAFCVSKRDSRSYIEVSTESATEATVTLRLKGVALDTAVVHDGTSAGGASFTAAAPAFDEYAKTGTTDGSSVNLKGVGSAVAAGVGVKMRALVTPSLCFSGVCAAVAIESRMDSKLGADATLSNAKAAEDTLKWTMGSKHTAHAEYTQGHVKAYTVGRCDVKPCEPFPD